MTKNLELVCPAGTPAALRVAVEAGAHAVYCGFRNETNARNFPGLNFTKDELIEGVKIATDNNSKVFVAINTFANAGNFDTWKKAVDDAATGGAYAIIAADVSTLEYAKNNHPNLRRHLSVQATAATAEAINYYQETFNVQRVVLPRVLSVREIFGINSKINVETEIFVYGGLCVMAEGRCSLSSFVTGRSPNKDGVCSPAEFVTYEEKENTLISKLDGSTINTFPSNEPAGYPTICKGRYIADGKPSYLFEEPTSLSVIEMLPDIAKSGVTALKIEGRQRGKAYVHNVVKAFRSALDSIATGKDYDVSELVAMSEGGRQTKGPYTKRWH